MSILYFLIPISLLFLCLGIWAFFWMVNNEQFDQLDAAGKQILEDSKSNQADN